MHGPSPHTRGNRAPGCRTPGRRGSIPAHAGQPACGRNRALRARVHPRTRGATPGGGPGGSDAEGPSPHTRGNRRGDRRRVGRRGSIPAHAGQPCSTTSTKCACRVHPRTRGATLRANNSHVPPSGPSPHTRGNLVRHVERHAPTGSIPAHAGQPTALFRVHQPRRVHPRTRGATAPAREFYRGRAGPSPHTRGNPGTRPRRSAYRGSIPAHAGQPLIHVAGDAEHGVHPRTRGATELHHAIALNEGGPSPHTRGNRADPRA